jgi:Ca2+-binding RTX toxin-like protein
LTLQRWDPQVSRSIGSDNFETYTQGIATLLVEDPTPLGTTGDDAFVLTYLSTNTSGNVSISRSTNGGAVEDLGVFPMNVALTLDGHDLVLLGFEARVLAGQGGGDTYRFDADTSLGNWNLDESGGGTDTLTGNSLANTLTGGPGNDTLSGLGGNDKLSGGLANDTYVFEVPTASEADVVNEAADQGLDTLSFATIATAVTLNLGSLAIQPVHANRTLKLNAQTSFENIIGGTGPDVLTGNLLNNILNGGVSNDTLTGVGGNDTLIGGLNDDTYVFGTASSPEADVVQEQPGEGADTPTFSR